MLYGTLFIGIKGSVPANETFNDVLFYLFYINWIKNGTRKESFSFFPNLLA